MSVNVRMLKEYIQNDMNVLITGLAGTGKTAMLRQAAAELGLNMKYYSAPTIDPFTDLVGIPVPQNDTETIKYYRPHFIDDAEIVFMDEMNRADTRTLNAIFEMIQFGTINGEKLPKLRCVVAAINPDDGDYTVEALDPALLDRFDIYLEADPTIDVAYFSKKFGNQVALAVKTWWTAYHQTYTAALRNTRNNAVYISPRRMEKIVANYLRVPNVNTLKNSMPPGAAGDFKTLQSKLDEAIAKQNAPAHIAASVPSGSTIADLLKQDDAQLRSGKSCIAAKSVLEDDTVDDVAKEQLLDRLASALNQHVGGPTLAEKWAFAVTRMSKDQMKTLIYGWTSIKRRQLDAGLQEAAN